MEQNQEKQEIVAVEDSNKRLLFLNQTYFVYSVMTIVKLIQSTSVSALENKKVNLFFLYTDTLVLPQAEIQAKVKEALALLLTKLKKA